MSFQGITHRGHTESSCRRRQDLQSPLRQDTVSCGIALIDMKKQHRSSPRTSICFIVCIETQNV